jgi:hypothetical protein
MFPLLELPTGNEHRGLGAGHVSAFLPIWVQKSFGEWTTYGGGVIGSIMATGPTRIFGSSDGCYSGSSLKS